MQNEELVRAHAELEEAYLKYTDLYDFAPSGYFTLSREGNSHQVNLAGANLLGVERANLSNRHLGLFASVQSRAAFRDFFEMLLSGVGTKTYELAFLKKEKELIWVRAEATCFEGGQESRVVMVDITRSKKVEEDLRHLSIHDSLTGLYNRGFFMEEMARLERGRDFPVSIVMGDVDGLKEINDKEGHAAGDILLKSVAQVLAEAFRAEDVIARVGGDEFAVLLPSTNATAAEVSIQRVRRAIHANNAGGTPTSIHLSLGVSTAEKTMPLLDVLKIADENMYREKEGPHASKKDNNRQNNI
jgi:diguanylate cyclase (GGDEF)-like protein/PAS domain S-box-containing protein